MNYNLKRIAMNALMNNETLQSDINSSLDGGVDYWTEIEAPDDQFYEVNVCSLGTWHKAVVYIHEQGYDHALMEFNVDLDTLMPAIVDKTHRVCFQFISHYYIDIDAKDSGEALKIARKYKDDCELIEKGSFDKFEVKITSIKDE